MYMNIQVERLDLDQESCYETFLHAIKHSLLYTSIKYREFLKRILIDSQDFYLLAYEAGKIVGAIPTFIKYNARYGHILNSLPFYGSHGGVMIAPYATDVYAVRKALLTALETLAAEQQVVISTLIANPLKKLEGENECSIRHTLRDERIGQVTILPPSQMNEELVQAELFNQFHPMRRRNIRKAQKSGVTVSHSDSLDALHVLAELHRQNIEAIGGLFKPWGVFQAIRETFTYDRDYRVYLAQKDGEIIAVLLIFFYNRTVEYYTPATMEACRHYQGLSLLIYEAMQEAIRRGYLYWNWGGTWLTQDGVYQFKKRWGAIDKPYSYYVCEYDETHAMRSSGKAELLAEYPYFYVIPFHCLNSTEDIHASRQ